MSAPDREQPGSQFQLRVLEGPQAGEEFELEGPTVVGRSSASVDVVLKDPEASRQHASLVPEGEGLSIEDLGSTNGTFVNGERVERKRAVGPGDRLRIGTTVFEVATASAIEQVEADAAEPAEAEAGEPEPADAAPVAEAGPPEEAEEPEAEEAEPEAEEAEEAKAEEGEDAEPADGEEPAAETDEEAGSEEGEEAEDEEAAEAGAEGEAAPTDEDEAEPAAAAAAASDEGETAAIAKLVHERIGQNLATILRAWSNRDAGSLRPHVSRDYLERAREAFDQLDRDFQMNCVEDLELKDVAVQRPAGDAEAEPVYAYVAFLGRDWIEDLRTKEVLDGDAVEVQAFTERWTLVPEGRRGWVIDHVESVWSSAAESAAREGWAGLPDGWYSRRGRPSTWTHWNGETWIAAPALPTGA